MIADVQFSSWWGGVMVWELLLGISHVCLASFLDINIRLLLSNSLLFHSHITVASHPLFSLLICFSLCLSLSLAHTRALSESLWVCLISPQRGLSEAIRVKLHWASGLFPLTPLVCSAVAGFCPGRWLHRRTIQKAKTLHTSVHICPLLNWMKAELIVLIGTAVIRHLSLCK